MYKVLLVDDEKNIIDGLSVIIDWNGLGCEICATAANGEDGVEAIKKYSPDIIITDIKMKAMTGLEMLEQSADFIGNAKTIVMTGYRDFEYAHKAISLGVSAFVLKPADFDELTRAIENAAAELDREEKIKKKLTAIKDNISETDNAGDAERGGSHEAMLNFTECTDMFDMFIVITMDVSEKVLKNMKNEIYELFDEIMENHYDLHFLTETIDNEVTIVLSSNNKDFFAYGNLYPKLESARKSFEKIFSKNVCMGVSTTGVSGKETKIKYLESKRALEHKLYTNGDSTLFYTDIQHTSGVSADVSIMEDPICAKLVNCILSGNEAALDDNFKEFEKLAESVTGIKELKNVCIQMIFKIYDLYKSMNENIDNAEARKSIKYIIEKCGDRTEIIRLVQDVAKNVTKKFYDYNNTLFGVTLKKAVSYVSENFSRLLTRDDIARAVGVTPSYVSILFRKGFDMTFVEYITGVRIREAKKLLKNTDKKVYQIAETVGFEDAYYFSKTFKNVTGISPKEYRIQNQK